MDEEIIHLRIALLCSFPPKFMLARLHPFPPTPLAVDERAVDVFGQHKSLCRGMTPTPQCPLHSSEQSLLACGICLLFSRKYSLGGLEFLGFCLLKNFLSKLALVRCEAWSA